MNESTTDTDREQTIITQTVREVQNRSLDIGNIMRMKRNETDT